MTPQEKQELKDKIDEAATESNPMQAIWKQGDLWSTFQPNPNANAIGTDFEAQN